MARGGSSGRRSGGGGRIRPGDRDTDDVTQPIAASEELHADDAAAIRETESKSMKNSCRRDYRNRNERFMQWLSTSKYKQYYRDGIRPVAEDETLDESKYYFGKTRDLVYAGFRVDIFKAFLSATKVKKVDEEGNNILKSPEDIRKYGDAIKFGADIAGEMLSKKYYDEMDKYKASYKKEYADAKKEGRVEENDAEPITSQLFRLMCEWALKENNVFVWTFGLFQWNLMARSINVDPLSFHNLKRGVSDSIECVPDATKSDPAGQFVTMKNLYGNPKEPQVSLFLAMSVWVSLNSSWLSHTERLFLKKGIKEGSASKKYCRQLAEMMKRHNDIAMKHINTRRANPHGVRKVRIHKCDTIIISKSSYNNRILSYASRVLEDTPHLAVCFHHLSSVLWPEENGLWVKLLTHTSNSDTEATCTSARCYH